MNPFYLAAAALLLLSRSRPAPQGAGQVVPGMVIRNDTAGYGHYHASRGNRLHQGVDLVVVPGAPVRSPINGTVTREARPYPGESWSGIVIEGEGGLQVKIFYMRPTPGIIGRQVRTGDLLGTAQAISLRYTPNMIDHVHVEYLLNGRNVDPTPFLFPQVSGISGLMKPKKVEYRGRTYNVQVSPWFEPYQAGSNKTRLREFTASDCGVYLIRTKRSEKIRYVGYSSTQLYKTLYRHFQSWQDASQYRVEYDRRQMEVMILETPCSVANAIEQAYRIKYDPPDNDAQVNPDLFKPVRRLPTENYNTTDPNAENYVPF